MRVAIPGHGQCRQAPPGPLGPSVEILVDDKESGGELAAADLTIPAGGGMPEHTHGSTRSPSLSCSTEN